MGLEIGQRTGIERAVEAVVDERGESAAAGLC
jgi:hypothetical protein